MTHSHETPTRSLAKAMSWRFWASLDTFIVTWVMALAIAWYNAAPMPDTWHLFVLATGVSVGEILTKTAHYWMHERLWARVRWGIKALGR